MFNCTFIILTIQAGITGPAIKTPNVIVNIEQTGRNDFWGMIQTFSLNEIMLARTQDLEMLLHQIMEMEKKTGKYFVKNLILTIDQLF